MLTIDLDTIYKNAFVVEKSVCRTQLKKEDIVAFTEILRSEITSMQDINVIYKNVYFDAEKKEKEQFLSNNFGVFSEIGNDVYLSKRITNEELNKVNSVYDNNVQEAITQSRNLFFSYCSLIGKDKGILKKLIKKH